MNLVELYEKIPVEHHHRIHIVGSQVFLRTPKGYFGPHTNEKVIKFNIDAKAAYSG